MNKNDWLLDKNVRSSRPHRDTYSKNILRPVYNDDAKNCSQGSVTKALTAASGIEGTKTYHDVNRGKLALTQHVVRGKKTSRRYRLTKNNLGKTVRVGKVVVVKKKDIKERHNPSRCSVPLTELSLNLA